jgi:hypothetical protein
MCSGLEETCEPNSWNEKNVGAGHRTATVPGG